MDLEFELQPCDTLPRFFDGRDRLAFAPTELLAENEDREINNDAVLSILQFGAIVPPLSPWTGIHRCLPGYQYLGTRMVGPVDLPESLDTPCENIEVQADEVEQVLDCILRSRIGENGDPVVLFSGGVDSGVIASRLVALGYRNSLLINYSFGEDDSETDLAEEMARQLGLPFERVVANEGSCLCLESPGRVYVQPFGDHSTVPTSALARAVVQRLANDKRVIIDGTGADGAFGMLAKIRAWDRVGKVPMAFRKAAAVVYEKMFWGRKGTIESVGRISRRSIEMPLVAAVLAQNPLAGVFYSGDANYRLHELLQEWIGGWAGSRLERQIIGADLALTCANIFAQKGNPIFEASGHRVLYPFLEPEMVSMAFRASRSRQRHEAKAALKKSLSRHVTGEMVYRPKSGFFDQKGEVFFSDEFIEYLFSAVESSGPISDVLERKPVTRACNLLARRKALPAQTLNLLWAIVFTDRWYRTAVQ